MLEIGVQSGGSTRVWKRYVRGALDYVALDIDPRCRMFQSLGEGIRILTGSQTDKTLPLKTNQLPPPPQPLFVALTRGGVVSPVFQKIGILFNIEKGVGPNVLLTRGGGSWFEFNGNYVTVASGSA